MNEPFAKTKRKIWQMPEQEALSKEIVEAAEGSDILAQILVRRGIKTLAQAESFLDASKYQETDPFVFADMVKAINRIDKAIAQGEKITVYGDYDVDGVTATAVVLTVLKKLGANVDYYIPNRANEGYGLNLKAVSILASKHRTKLIISCDCGISNFAEINLAKSLGVETIIVDHHSMPEVMPPAIAILHPKQFTEEHPLFHLPGVGVAYKLAEAILTNKNKLDELIELQDFVTMGMIADMVPLVRENRYLVQVGLPVLLNTKRPGLRALLDNTAKMDGADIVGFGLAPRINAVGRLADANLAVKLLTTDSENEATEIARQLELENVRRQELCETIFFEADKKAKIALADGKDKAIALYDKNWHHGVVGIVASRLVEKYHCPVFIAEYDADESKLKGSCRSVAGVDLYKVLKNNEHLLTKWGGHQMAAGFSAESENAEALCRALLDTCNQLLVDSALVPVLEIDAQIESDELNFDLLKLLNKLGPFGMWNKKPVFRLDELKVLSVRPLGKEGKHHKLMLLDKAGENQFECVFWRSANLVPNENTEIDLVFTAEINSFNNVERMQLVLCDWRPAGDESFANLLSAVETENSSVSSVNSVSSVESLDIKCAELDDFAKEIIKEAPRIKAQTSPVQAMTWKDLRDHLEPLSVLEAAYRNLADKLAVFVEASKVPIKGACDRSNIESQSHLLLWQFPPNVQVFRNLISKSRPSVVYLLGADTQEELSANEFLKKLLALVRFAVNKKEGQAEADKVAAALACSKMSIALGLSILHKVNVLEWFAEGSTLYFDLVGGAPCESWEEFPEFRQLSNSLKETHDFRQWCREASILQIQTQLFPNSIKLHASEEVFEIEKTYGKQF